MKTGRPFSELRGICGGHGSERFAKTALVVSAILMCIGAATAINFDVAPGKEECFFEEVHEGTQIQGVYAVVQGSHLDIDVQVFNPRGSVVYNAKRDGEGKFSLKAESDGTYKFCFSNKVRTVLPEWGLRLPTETGKNA